MSLLVVGLTVQEGVAGGRGEEGGLVVDGVHDALVVLAEQDHILVQHQLGYTGKR